MQQGGKPFQQWNFLKQSLHRREWQGFIREGEVWFCSIGVNVGWEEDRKNNLFERPIIVIRKLSRHYFWGIPLTTKQRVGDYYFSYTVDGRIVTALLMQMRLFDCRRLQRKVGNIHGQQLYEIRTQIATILLKKSAPITGASEHANKC